MFPELTLKQNRFVKAVTDPETESRAEAARRAGYSRNNAANAACLMMKNPKVLKAIERIERGEADRPVERKTVAEQVSETFSAHHAGAYQTA